MVGYILRQESVKIRDFFWRGNKSDIFSIGNCNYDLSGHAAKHVRSLSISKYQLTARME